jgi:hypothetical protein
MALPGIPIPETQCIGDSLFSINNALTALDASVIELINAGASVTVSTTAPGGASLGDLWYDSDNGILSVYYDLQWVDVGAGGGGGGITDVTGTAPITVTGTDVKNVSVNVASLTATLDDYFVASSGGGGSFNAPVGYVGYYAATSAPAGWMECNGVVLEVADGPSYTNLRNFLIANGSPFGNDEGNPKIPDLRGRFIRSNGSDGTYSSGTFGAKQADAMQGHIHRVPIGGSGCGNGSPFTGITHICTPQDSGGPLTDGVNGTPRTASETRPANLALLACIKL